ncbi:hypothetical protein EDD21DRAFT_361701 [Dissophora ornata]|nr:hypothetical protein EDD21DRAFT_361701 [Dissophora ornata]
MNGLRLNHYRQVADHLSGVQPLGGSINEIVNIALNNTLKLGAIGTTCDSLGISADTLFKGIDVCGFLSTEAYRTALSIDLPDVPMVSAASVLQSTCRYMRQQASVVDQAIDPQLIIDAQILFMKNYDVFKAEIENEKMLEEIKLDTLRFENVNKRQLDITIRNTYITLAGVIVTALLTVANIIVSVVIKQ